MIKLLALALLFIALYSVESSRRVHSKKTAQTVRTIPSVSGTIRQTAKCQTLSNIQLSDTVGGISIVLTRRYHCCYDIT
jgi:ABC-type transport system involved in cytochrome c biogenesis permease subunit